MHAVHYFLLVLKFWNKVLQVVADMSSRSPADPEKAVAKLLQKLIKGSADVELKVQEQIAAAESRVADQL